MKKTVILLFLLCPLLSACLKDDDLKLKNIEYVPAILNDGWEIEAPSAENYNMTTLDELMNHIYSEDDFLLVHSLVVVRNGKLMIESYSRNLSDRDTPHHLWSTTKSFMSLLTGIAIDQGYIQSVSDSVFDYIPEYLPYAKPMLRTLTIEQCLTMRSGIDYNNDEDEEDEVLSSVPGDLTRYMLERPVIHTPGEVAFYKNSDPQLLVPVISGATQTDLIDYADQHLMDPLGIKNYYWSREQKDNTPFGGFGLWMIPRDLAKVGQMLLNRGTWNSRRIVSEAYIEAATTPKTTINGFDYGYLFWIDTEKGYYWTWGAGGQFVFVVPDENLVVVITSEQFADNQNTTIDQATFLVDEIIQGIQ